MIVRRLIETTRSVLVTAEYVVYAGHPKTGGHCYFAKNVRRDDERLWTYVYFHSGMLGMDGVE